MGKIANSLSKYKVSIHSIAKTRSGGSVNYRYASTQPYVVDENGKKKYYHVQWGTVDENLKFYPGKKYIYADPAERAKLIFPSDWDLSEIQRILPNIRETRRGHYKVLPQTVFNTYVKINRNSACGNVGEKYEERKNVTERQSVYSDEQ